MQGSRQITILTIQVQLNALLFFLSVVSSAFSQQLNFDLVQPPSGMHYGSKAGVQDVQGYMWIGTYQAPLRRYDGYNYTYYFNNPFDSNSLAQNWVEALCAARDGTLWIGTPECGLDHLDPATGRFTHFRYNPKDSNSLSSDYVTTILEDREGLIWIGTSKGLNTYDPKTGKFNRYFHHPQDPYSLSCNHVAKVYEDRQGTVWVGTGNAWQRGRTRAEEGGLNRFEKRTGRFIQYLHEPNNPHSLINNKVSAIFEDDRGIFWVGTAGDGLHTMNRTTGTFERHRYDPADPEKLSRPPQKRIRAGVDDYITFIIEDAAGAIWIGTFGNGLNRYNPKTNKVTHYPLFTDPITGFRLEVAWWACNSRDGMLWIGYWRGLYRIDPLQNNIPYFATGTAVGDLYEDKFGMLWYGTEDEGLVRKDIRTGIERHFVFDPNNPSAISNNRIGAVYEDHKGELWIGTVKGLDHFDRKTGTFSHFRFNSAEDNTLINDGVGSIWEDRRGSFWLGTQAGLLCVDRQSHTITRHYAHSPEDMSSLSKGEILLIYEDNNSNLWLGTFGGTLNKLSLQTGKVQRFLHGTNVHSLCQDSKGIMWVGTSTGLYRSNAALDSISQFHGPNGEFGGNVIVNGIIEDNEKALWLNASVGICRLDPQRSRIIVFDRHKDPIWYNGTGCYKSTNDELFFGGGGGYFTFFPGQLKENIKPPDIVINEFKLADHVVMPGKEQVLKQSLAQTKKILLRHNQNVFSLSFAGIHYCNPDKNKHLFMLEGLDKSWRRAGSEKVADYYNVPPGHYIFRIRAANSYGIWAEKSIAIIINPPWWSTWWAYAMYIFGFVTVLWIFTWYRSHRLKAENLLLEGKVIKRTAELEQSMQERYELSKKLESQQALLNERLRISRELHDDIGSTLGSISIYSEVAKKRTEKNENTNEVLSKIGLASRELIDKMSDIVWSLNPNNESFEQLQNRMLAFAAMVLASRNIQYDFSADKELKKLQFKGEQLKNIFLIFKEALHNIVKYAGCKTVHIALSVKNNTLLMTVTDDGQGFQVSQQTSPEIQEQGGYLGGNGINNMRSRAQDLNAGLCIHSAIDEGTTVQLTLPVSITT